MMIRSLTAAVVFAVGSAAVAAPAQKAFRLEETFAISRSGTLTLENPVGNIEIFGSDEEGITAEAMKHVLAPDESSIEEARAQTLVATDGNDRARVLRTTVPPPPARRWSSIVHWRVRVPKSLNVRVISNSGDYVRILNVHGTVFVKNFNGTISFENVTGGITADSVNGSISFNSPGLRYDVQLTTVNGHISARVAAGNDLRWVAETARGDIRTNLPVRGMFTGTTFRGSVNAPGGPTLRTTSLLGNIHLLGAGVPIQTARSLRTMTAEMVWVPPDERVRVVGALRRTLVESSLTYTTKLGDIVINEIRGDAQLATGAGKVQVGAVSGDCTVRSQGGAVQLGEILGALRASTLAGDILVEAARRGGVIDTSGGTIRLLYTGGPTRLVSGGGDVVVRQAAGPVSATTRSGDISITVDRLSRRQKIDAQTEKGNVVLNVGSDFGADVDITLVTSRPDVNVIHSDFPGLSIRKEPLPGGRTRVYATGKINGGGERLSVQAADGSVRIISAPVGPTLVGR